MPKNTEAPRRNPVLIIDRSPANPRRQGKLSDVGGSKGDTWNDTLLDQACRSLWHAHSDPDTYDKQLDGVLAALQGIAPRNEMEAMAAAQMIAAHNAAMECHRRAMCQRRRENASARRSKNASVRLAGRPPAGGLPAFRDHAWAASAG